ncbi:MAG: hypothetical protein MN733_15100 [Nitrososphaera sp.]|nr:hypothetical protein [Nitrososphaera sp.]
MAAHRSTDRFMGKSKAAKESQKKSDGEQSLPAWAEEEIKSVQFGKPETITRTGYILDIYESEYKVDIQVYEPMPDGRSIVEGLDVPRSIKVADFMKGFVYEFKVNVFAGPLSPKLVELLKTSFSLDMKAIYRFELKELQLMDVESDLPVAPVAEESED